MKKEVNGKYELPSLSYSWLQLSSMFSKTVLIIHSAPLLSLHCPSDLFYQVFLHPAVNLTNDLSLTWTSPLRLVQCLHAAHPYMFFIPICCTLAHWFYVFKDIVASLLI